jgi:hypothetical protein
VDRVTLDVRTLLVAARAVGLVVAAEGDRLSVHGPKGAVGLARLVLGQKADILAALEAESPPATLPEAAAAGLPPWPPRPAELIEWPVEWRARWGQLANEQEDQGVPFPDSVRRAYHLVEAEMDAARARGEQIEFHEPDPGLSDSEALSAIDRAADTAWWTRPPGTDYEDHGPRDVRRGDRWLAWHFTPEFEERMRRER